MASSVVVDGLGKRYRLGGAAGRAPREIWALKDVSFGLDRGTILGVIGPNGAGKTTLLKVLARITPPTEGRVIGRGRVVSLLEMTAGFQPDLSVRDNVFLNAALYGIPRSEVLARLDRIVEFAGLATHVDRAVRYLSSGMYLRLAFSVAVNMDPDILLADEVLAVGDLEFQERCLQRVQEAGRAGMTVLFVSHDMEAIRRLCDRVLWVSAGRVVQLGNPEETVRLYREATLRGPFRPSGGPHGSHVNEFVEIVRVELMSAAGEEIGAARITEDVKLGIIFRTFQERLMVRCAADVYAMGVHAFRSVQPTECFLGEPGAYRATVTIPAHLLAETSYSTNVSVTIFRGVEEHPVVLYNAVAFQAYDNNPENSARGTYKGPLPGVVAPKLDWIVERQAAGQ